MSAGRLPHRLRAVDAAVVGVAAAMAVLGLVLMVVLPLRGTEYAREQAAPICATDQQVLALTRPCKGLIPATVVSALETRNGAGEPEPVLRLRWSAAPAAVITLDIAQPTRLTYRLHPGSAVSIHAFDGYLFGVDAPGATVGMQTTDSLRLADEVRTDSGGALLVIAALLVVVDPPVGRALVRRLPGRLAGQEAPSLGQRLLHDRAITAALLALVAVQLGDIGSSIWGAHLGYYEGNQLALIIIDAVGLGRGLLLFKLPVVIGAILLLAVLPRRAALLATLAATVVSAAVVIDNLVLFIH